MADNDNLLEMYLFENSQLLEQLEELLLGGEKNACLNEEQINETFRVMHTIKGSSAMMEFDTMSKFAHAVEDLFSKLREDLNAERDWARIFDIVLEAMDFFKEEMQKIENGSDPDGNADALVAELKEIKKSLEGGAEAPSSAKAEEDSAVTLSFSETAEDVPFDKLAPEDGDLFYKAKVLLEQGCQMETIRAFGVVIALKDFCSSYTHIPENLDDNCDEDIAANGITIYMTVPASNIDVIKNKLDETLFMQSYELTEVVHVKEEAVEAVEQVPVPKSKPQDAKQDDKPVRQSFISVNVNKVDKLMNLVGEIVTSESMVTKNPDIADLHLENFDKQARILRKLTDELQDIVMSIRMVPISSTFHKMQRIVRDMCKKVGKQAELKIIGEETEVDKNIIDQLSDPLMHIIRNAMDHGIEKPEVRAAAGKDPKGTIRLEAKNSGGDVIVIVSDDGKGLNKDVLITKAIERGLTYKAEHEITDKEAYGFILMPGFSTKSEVTEFSGRGVGMDVVQSNIEKVGGRVTVESEPGNGMSIIMHIPLTLAIVDGMKITVGDSMYIVPTMTIRESVEPRLHRIVREPNGKEFIIIRGECCPILRLDQAFGVQAEAESLEDGIMVLVESEAGVACLFADKLIGEQQAVVKPIPLFITKQAGRLDGIAGCSIMGDGSICLILDINSLLSVYGD